MARSNLLRRGGLYALLAPSVLLAACGSKGPQPPPTPEPAPAVENTGPPSDQLRELEQQIADLQLQLLERQTQVTELQAKLDEAIQEVVRTQAKLRSFESKAEAASTMAETEIALKALRAAAAGTEPGPGITQAEQLLKMSAEEFDRENFGGSLYLASQAKDLISNHQLRLSGNRVPLREGEILFASPLPLQVMRRSNVRDGPGLGFQILFVLETGTRLVGHARMDQWVRIRDEEGRDGWIFHTLVGSRSERQQ